MGFVFREQLGFGDVEYVRTYVVMVCALDQSKLVAPTATATSPSVVDCSIALVRTKPGRPRRLPSRPFPSPIPWSTVTAHRPAWHHEAACSTRRHSSRTYAASLVSSRLGRSTRSHGRPAAFHRGGRGISDPHQPTVPRSPLQHTSRRSASASRSNPRHRPIEHPAATARARPL